MKERRKQRNERWKEGRKERNRKTRRKEERRQRNQIFFRKRLLNWVEEKQQFREVQGTKNETGMREIARITTY